MGRSLPDGSIFLESEPVGQWFVLLHLLGKHDLLSQALGRLNNEGSATWIGQEGRQRAIEE